MKNYILVLLFCCLVNQAYSQKLLAGNSISYLSGSGNFGDQYDTGFGLNFNGELGLFGQVGITGEIGWNHWSNNNSFQGSEVKDFNTYNLMIGGKLGLSFLYLEMRTGYHFGKTDELVVIPAVGLRLGKLDLNVGYQVVGGFNFMNFRLGYFWI